MYSMYEASARNNCTAIAPCAVRNTVASGAACDCEKRLIFNRSLLCLAPAVSPGYNEERRKLLLQLYGCFVHEVKPLAFVKTPMDATNIDYSSGEWDKSSTFSLNCCTQKQYVKLMTDVSY